MRTLLAITSVVLCAIGTPAASAADKQGGSAQVAGFGGLVAGIGTQGSVGSGVSYAATERIFARGEFSNIPGGSPKISGVGFAAKASARAYDFNGGIHFQFPLKEPKAVPCVAAGVGALHGSASATASVMGTTVSTKASATDFYFNFGGGLRYYVSDRWGIRPELKIFAGDETFVRLAIGLFYQFGKWRGAAPRGNGAACAAGVGHGAWCHSEGRTSGVQRELETAQQPEG